MATPTTLAQYQQAIAALKTQISALEATVQQDAQEIASLQSRVQALQTAIGQAEAQRANTIVSYGPWSNCSAQGRQTRLVTYGDGHTATQTRSCTPPPVVQYTFLRYVSFSARSCLLKYEVMNHMSNGQNIGTGRYVYRQKVGCVPNVSG